MTAKNIMRPSIDGDRYSTPTWAVQQVITHVLPRLLPGAPTRILEPCAGKGVFVEHLRKAYPKATITANDIDKPKGGKWKDANVSQVSDFLRSRWRKGRYELGITNPPFTVALEFAEQMIQTCGVVVLLVRQGFLASQKRYAFFKTHRPARIFLMTSRPSFAYDGQTDTADYCWVCWTPETPSALVTKLHWLPPPKVKTP